MKRLSLPVGVTVVAVLVSAAQQLDQLPDQIKGWGKAVDPDSNSKFEVVGTGVKIVVSPGIHNLVSGENMSAPRVLRSVSADFIAQVKVVGDVRPGGERQSQYYPYHGTGLLLWQDDKNYVRLERAAIFREGTVTPYINFEVFREGERALAEGMAIEAKPVWLRLEYRDGRLHASASLEGTRWMPFRPYDTKFAKNVRIGVAAISNTSAPFQAHLDGFVVFQQLRHEDAGNDNGDQKN